jgi:hypothetical protein
MNHEMPHRPAGSQPVVVAWLGYGGLLPFVFLTFASFADPAHAPLWRDTLLAYGAIILGFVGALHWGFAMHLPNLKEQQRSAAYLWSVLPALVAWPALLLPAHVATPLLMGGFIANYLRDRYLDKHAELPGWYLPLRFHLTMTACICLVGSLFAA